MAQKKKKCIRKSGNDDKKWVITINLSEVYVDCLDLLVKHACFRDRSDIICRAINKFIQNESSLEITTNPTFFEDLIKSVQESA